MRVVGDLLTVAKVSKVRFRYNRGMSEPAV
jgi:hypothetical protein